MEGEKDVRRRGKALKTKRKEKRQTANMDGRTSFGCWETVGGSFGGGRRGERRQSCVAQKNTVRTKGTHRETENSARIIDVTTEYPPGEVRREEERADGWWELGTQMRVNT